MAVELASAYVSIVPSTRGIKGQLEKGLGGPAAAAGKSAGSRFGSAFSGIAKTAVRATGAAVAAALGASLVKGFGRLKALDDARFKLQGLGHDAAGVETIMESALAAVKGTAFGLGDAATIAASAVAAGIPPGEELTRVLSLTGDAASIAGVGLGEMGSIFGKVAASNRMMTEEMNQLQDRGLPVLAWLQEELGATADEVRDMVSSGEVDFATFTRIIEDNIGGAALTAGESFTGSLANMGAAAGRFGAALMGSAFAGAPALFGRITAGIDRMTEAVGPKVEVGIANLQYLGSVFMDAASGMTMFVTEGSRTEAIAASLGAAFSGVGPGISYVLEVIRQLPAAFASGFAGTTDRVGGFTLVFEQLGGIARDITQGMAGSWGRLGGIFSSLSTTGYILLDAIGALAPAVAAATAAVGVTAWGLFLTVAETLATVVATVLAPAIQSVALWLADHQSVVTTVVAGYTAWAVITKTIAFGKLIQGIAMATKAWVLNAIAAAKSHAVTAFLWAMEVKAAAAAAGRVVASIGRIVAAKTMWAAKALLAAGKVALSWLIAMGPIGLVIAAVVGLVVVIVKNWDTIKRVTADLWNKFTAWARDAWARVTESVSSGITRLVTWFRELPGRIMGALGNLGSMLFNAGRDMIQGLIDGAKSLLRNVGNFFLDLVPGWIRGPLEKALGIASPSKVGKSIGENFMESITAGVAANVRPLASVMSDVAGTMALDAPTLRLPPAAIRGGDGADIGSAADAGPFIGEYHVHNPIPETEAESLPRAVSRATFLVGG